MLTMNADCTAFLLALCFTCVSSNEDEGNSCAKYLTLCATQTLHAPPGSSVLLPCIFSTSGSNWTTSWTHIDVIELIELTSVGRIKFLQPRRGRVKAFPNQAIEGNYSIRIDELENSDMGCYRCRRGRDCLQVELTSETGRPSEKIQRLIYICVGIAVFLLTLGSYCCIRLVSIFSERAQDYAVNPAGAGTNDASAPPLEAARGPADNQPRGQDNLVYENDDQGPAHQQGAPTINHGNLPGFQPDLVTTQHTQSTSGLYPNLSQFQFERAESRRTKQRFHTELFSRLRQASLSRHFYVNQGEIRTQQAMAARAENQRRGGYGNKRVKENCDYKNPIYNQSMEHLNHQ